MTQRAIIVMVDGLRRDMVSATQTPRIAGFASQATQFVSHRSVFPSATRIASASFATGCHPSRHGLIGSAMVLQEGGELVLHDTGSAEFLQHKREVTGRSLGVPTIAERLKDDGGVAVYSNVSPGAAYAHDPDGYGRVFHRAGAFGPGRVPLCDEEQMRVGPDIAGDEAMTGRFIDDALRAGAATVGVLWFGHPDETQHAVPLGSPDHLSALTRADRNAGRVMDAVENLRAEGEDVLLLVGSDHGHQTVAGVIDIAAELVDHGLKEGVSSSDVVVAPNGTAALIYVDGRYQERVPEIAAFLSRCAWVGQTFVGGELDKVGLHSDSGLAIAVSMRASAEQNPYGVAGSSFTAEEGDEKSIAVGCGSHGGLGAEEQSPFLMVSGPGFSGHTVCDTPTTIVDIAPTVLAHLGKPAVDMDGEALQSISRSVRRPA